MNILITGSSGFIGSSLVKRLIQKGHNIFGSSRNEVSRETKLYSFFHINKEPYLLDWSSILSQVDCVVHLAAKVHEMDKNKSNNISLFMDTNTRFTLHLAKQSLNSGVKRFIFLSTIKVNGEFTKVNRPFTSKDMPNPTDAYSISKYEAEIGLSEICRNQAMELVIIRVPLVYGPGVKANFKSLVNLLSKNLPLPFLSLNVNRRSLLSIDNLIDFIDLTLSHPLAPGHILLVSDDYVFSTKDLIQELGISIGHPAKLFYIPRFILFVITYTLGLGKIYSRLSDSLELDISKTRKLLNWQPPYLPSYTFRKLKID